MTALGESIDIKAKEVQVMTEYTVHNCATETAGKPRTRAEGEGRGGRREGGAGQEEGKQEKEGSGFERVGAVR